MHVLRLEGGNFWDMIRISILKSGKDGKKFLKVLILFFCLYVELQVYNVIYGLF